MRRKRRGRQISVVVYPGLSTLELVGTVSALSGLGLETGFRTVTVGESREPVSPNKPMKLVPESTFEEAPDPTGSSCPAVGPAPSPPWETRGFFGTCARRLRERGSLVR